uniref:Uncharacterized protein n=1 Tax=Oryza sativa subsp. japonica TaxID=39947 RepID=Q6ZG74_ORYSJ|nr:hypothetical protein [Oryza sativa Japonica Group]
MSSRSSLHGGAAVLTTKFGNLSIGDEDRSGVGCKMEIVPETEQGSAKVRIGYDQDWQSPSWTRIKSTGTLTNLKASFWTCTEVKQISHASCFYINRQP